MKTIYSRLLAGVFLVISSLSLSHADSVAQRVGVSGNFAAATPLGDQSVMDHTQDAGPDLGGMFRYGVTSNFSVGASYDNIDLHGDKGERHRPETFLANFMLHLSPDKKVVPTLLAGFGVGSTEKDGTYTNFAARAGLGLDFFLTPTFSLGPQATYTFIENGKDAKDEYSILGIGLTASLYFGDTREKAAVAAAPPPAQPSPTPTLAAVPLVMTDSDGDGVLDSTDICPNTPRGIPVDANGCPKAIEQKVTIELKVLFDTGKSVVKPEYRSEIEQVANFLSAYPNEHAAIEGHTDNTGSADVNKRISQRRADAVREYLIKEFTVDPSRVSAMGYGPSQPVADNSTPEGREKNRRVVATLEATKVIQPH